MRLRAPGFWWRPPGWQAAALGPAAALYGLIAGRRMNRGARAAVPCPVICVGNVTLGGGGKTPTVLALADAAKAMGRRPGILTRGHGGTSRTPLLVDPARHGASLVGDEPMLLAQAAPTAVSPDRRAGARLLLEAGCDVLLMDDGFQSARLRIDLALVVVDAHRGLGNGRVFPAGPLRAPFRTQARHADAWLIVGARDADARLGAGLGATGRPIHRAQLAVEADGFAGLACLAFAGIADPAKFYRSLAEAGAQIVETRDFPDHHPLSEGEAAGLLDRAKERGLALVTTAKDRARLQDGGERARELARTARILPVTMRFADADEPRRILLEATARFEARRAG